MLEYAKLLAMKESDLYAPLKQFLEAQGYEVKGEIQDCDVMAVRGAEPPTVVELKLNLNLTVVLQAVTRLSITPHVYIGLPQTCKRLHRQRKSILKLMKMLGIGLIVIDPRPKLKTVEVMLDPKPYQPRTSSPHQKRLLGEFEKRVGDPNLGGMEKRKGIMTAYRQRALAIALFLQEHGPTKAAHIAKTLDLPKARQILYRDVYGWFDRESKGIYSLSPRGHRELPLWQTDFRWQHIE